MTNCQLNIVLCLQQTFKCFHQNRVKYQTPLMTANWFSSFNYFSV